MNNPDLDRLIVESVVDLDAAATRMDQLQSLLWDAQATTLRAWAASNGWLGEFDPKGDLRVWPKPWDGDGVPKAAFSLAAGPDNVDLGHYFELLGLLGAGGARTALWFQYKGPRPPWKIAARQEAETLAGYGFIWTASAHFQTDCTPVYAEMIDSVETADYAPMTVKITSALERTKAAVPDFTRLLSSLGAL
ncbi:hypothetical protein [Brevundimonas nasdae]|uniref:Uncharacterized protein n=1 Tax=Brevundimonas nasdae TaxID=172043 RepID=A0ABX8TJX2_9CAUL|nr:hypothetical protein [Brevundimonas nasdae]QYC11510.1 hypothetical protein KWG56_05910 [Brevundimonas nasdae]QYC14298.1 hypothetical protein KWG63_01245 [Brevundimonas nasdae]